MFKNKDIFRSQTITNDKISVRFYLVVIISILGLLIPYREVKASDDNKGIMLLDEIQNVFINISEKVKPTVVNVASTGLPMFHPQIHPEDGQKEKPDETPQTTGSGVIIDKRGYIVTNNHVVGETDELEVTMSDKTKYKAKVIGKDPDTDLAVIKIDTDKDLPYVPLGDSEKVKVGQWAIAVGNPYGLDRTVTVGVISALGRENVNLSRYENFIQTDASINPGNSGGPLFNIRGEVIGINTAIINFAQGIGFAIPSNMVEQVVSQLITKGKVVRGWLGVGIQPLTDDLSDKFGVKDKKGVLINETFKDDPAYKSGIRTGDIVLKIDGKEVDSTNGLARMIGEIPPHKKIDVEILRDGIKKNYYLELDERKDESLFASNLKASQPESLIIGIAVQNALPETDDKLNVKEDLSGVVITKVYADSFAAKGGLKEGDLLTEINRSSISNIEDFHKIAKVIKKDDSLLLRIIREKRAFYTVLNLKEKNKEK